MSVHYNACTYMSVHYNACTYMSVHYNVCTDMSVHYNACTDMSVHYNACTDMSVHYNVCTHMYMYMYMCVAECRCTSCVCEHIPSFFDPSECSQKRQPPGTPQFTTTVAWTKWQAQTTESTLSWRLQLLSPTLRGSTWSWGSGSASECTRGWALVAPSWKPSCPQE